MIAKVYEKINSKRLYFILFIIILTLLSSINIFHSGIIYGDDINFHMHRILAISDNIKIGKYVPVYFNYLNGFGYANGLFYPDLFLFIPAILNYLGLNLIFSLKVFILVINFSSVFFMYLCVYKITKVKRCAYISMILYAFSNYRLIDFVSRGAVGEMLAFVFLPLVILGLHEIFYGECKNGFYLTIGLSCLCFSHVISFYLMCFFTVLFILFNIKCLKDKNRLKKIVFYIILAMIITVHFWMPMLEQLLLDSFNTGINIRIFENVIPIYLVFVDFPSYSLSEFYPAGIGLFYYIGLFKFRKLFFESRFILTITLFGVISLLFSSLTIIWKIDLFYILFSSIQFPWRFYMFSTLFFIIVFSIIAKDIKYNRFIKLCLVYLILVFLINSLLFLINVYLKKPLEDEIMLGEYLPKNFNIDVVNSYSNKNIEFVRSDNVLVVSVLKNVKEIELPLIYYNGYKACNEICYDVYKTDNGLVGVKTDKDVTEFKVWYDGTFIYGVTMYISLIGVFVLIFIVRKEVTQ